MRFLVFSTLLAASTSVLANGGGIGGPCYPSLCGWQIVNGISTRSLDALIFLCITLATSGKLITAFIATTQSDIARAACGRDDTCGGREWNTIFHVGLTGDYSARTFCEKGCYRCKGEGAVRLEVYLM
jgi:hypothetical protein